MLISETSERLPQVFSCWRPSLHISRVPVRRLVYVRHAFAGVALNNDVTAHGAWGPLEEPDCREARNQQRSDELEEDLQDRGRLRPDLTDPRDARSHRSSGGTFKSRQVPVDGVSGMHYPATWIKEIR